jgi:non-ribosomal peptide synthetase component F
VKSLLDIQQSGIDGRFRGAVRIEELRSMANTSQPSGHRRQTHCIPSCHGEQQLSYSELNALANQLAFHLRTLGVGIEQRVALCTERGFGMVISLLAILKAGASYVPLDPSYPSERLLQILGEAGTQLILSDAAGRTDRPRYFSTS